MISNTMAFKRGVECLQHSNNKLEWESQIHVLMAQAGPYSPSVGFNCPILSIRAMAAKQRRRHQTAYVSTSSREITLHFKPVVNDTFHQEDPGCTCNIQTGVLSLAAT
jgi:hypothetical protein